MENDNGSEPYNIAVRKGPPVAPVQSEQGGDYSTQESSHMEPTAQTHVAEPSDTTHDVYQLHAPQNASSVLDQGPLIPEQSSPTDSPKPPKRPFRMSWRRTVGMTLVVVGLLAGVLLVLHNFSVSNKQAALNANLSDQSARIKTQSVALPGLGQQLLTGTAPTANTLTVNGSVVLSPSPKPSKAVAGQLYYNQSLNQMQYYDGTGFVALQGGASTTNIYSSTTTSGNTYVTNNVSNGTSISGTAETLAMFGSDGKTLADSLITQNGSTLTSNGILLVRPNTDSTTAFQVQDTNGGSLLTADTSNDIITSTGNVIVNQTGVCNYANYTSYMQSLTPVGYWKLEDSGTSATDSSGSGNTGTLSNVTTGQTPGPFACAASHPAAAFSITSSSVMTSHTTFNNPVNYSEVVMFKTTTGGPLMSFDQQPGPAGYDRTVYVGTDGKLYYMTFPNTTHLLNSKGTVNDGQWHIVIATQSSAGMDLYLDGSLIASNANYTLATNNIGEWDVGYAAGPFLPNSNYIQNFTGDIAEAGVIPFALNSSQVTTLASDAGMDNANLVSVGIGTKSPTANLDDAGTALFKNTVDSTQALQVSDSSGRDLLTIDTEDDAINLTGSALFQDSTDSTTAFQVQNASGSTTLLNVDTTNNEISLGTGAGAAFGNTKVGPNNFGTAQMTASKFTTTGGGTVTSMSAYIGMEGVSGSPQNQYQFAIYTDNGGTPSAYVASSAISTITPGNGDWNTLPITATLAPSTTYWLVFWADDQGVGGSGNGLASLTGNAGSSAQQANYSWQAGPDNGLPGTFPTGSGFYLTTNVPAIYASYAASGPALTISRYGTMTQSGAAIFQDPTDSTQTLQVEDSLGNVLFTADTADMEIIVGGSLSVSGNITVDGHIITGGSSPGVTAGAAATSCGGGGSPSVTISGDDTSGTITVTTGSGGTCTAGDFVDVTFANAFGDAPHVVLNPDSLASQALGEYSSSATTGLTLDIANTPATTTTYKWDYWVAQ